MKILFDHQIFSSQVHGGVSKYFAEVIHRLPQNTWKVSAWLSNNEYADNYNLFNRVNFFPNLSFRGKGRIMSEFGKGYSLLQIHKGNFDVFHQTNFDTYCLKPLKNKPMVTTYHDINFLTEMNYNERMIKLQKKSLERADRVIAISNNTKNDLLKYFDIDPDKITVIYHGIDNTHISPELSEPIYDKPYILYVGMRHAFKNFTRFVKAFGMIANKYPDIDVVCTRIPFSNEELDLFNKLGIKNRMHYCIADEITLNRLYKGALFFVFPSIYEGFGMPILEAMVNGCPVVLAKSSCFPEIAGDAALYFDPLDEESIKSAIVRMIDSESLRENYRKMGLEHVKLFSWDICANKHYQLYKSLL